MLIDTHAHLDFYEDVEPVLAAAEAAGVTGILAIGIGDGPGTMHRALEIARTRSSDGLRIWASAGIHPSEAGRADYLALDKLRDLAQDPLCVAVGEIGLDYYHIENPDVEVQQTAFRQQMGIAAEAGKPILLHCRTSELATPAAKKRFMGANASAEMLSLLESDWAPTGLPFVLHCFSGTAEDAARALRMGGYLSFAGNVTYPKAMEIQAVAATVASDRMLVETDSPFLTPVPLRGQQNQPAYVTYTAEFVAGLRGVSVEELRRTTTMNFLRVIGDDGARSR
jgi:TatD DNase family protein